MTGAVSAFTVGAAHRPDKCEHGTDSTKSRLSLSLRHWQGPPHDCGVRVSAVLCCCLKSGFNGYGSSCFPQTAVNH